MLATVKALAAKRAADAKLWKRDGDRSPAHNLARTTGTSVGEARAALALAEKLTDLPELSDAARSGQVSPKQAAPIADAAAADPASEARLLDLAGKASLGELMDECARTKAAAQPDDDARHKAIHDARHLRKRRCPDGAGELTYRSTPEEVAEIFSIAEGYARHAFEEARKRGDREPHEAYLADGLLAAVRAGSRPAAGSPRPPSPTKVIVRIDWDALVRGWPIEGELCEIAGIGPVPVSVVRAMIDSGDIFLAGVVTRGHDVVNVFHLGRQPTRFQQTALDWLSPTCVTLGCGAMARETDHREDWVRTKVTFLSWLERHCSHCHDLKTRLAWSLVEGTGKRPMVPPNDPRHPLYRGEARGPAPPEAA
jgi:hypothetical protein